MKAACRRRGMANTQLYPAGRGQEERGERLEAPTTPPAARSPRTAPSPNVSLCTQGLDVTWSPRALQIIFMEKKKKKITAGRSGQLYINAPWHFIMCTVILVSKHSAHMLWFLWITSSPPPQIVHRVPCRGNNSHLALKLEQSI